MTDTQWAGFIMDQVDRRCRDCRQSIPAHTLAVADLEARTYHVHCAAHDGWVPSESEAWTLALYRLGSEVPN